jgi:triacylglycerol lipase
LSLAATLRALGPRFDEEVRRATYELYVPLHQAVAAAEKDLPYGEDPRHRLDVFVPLKKPARPAPVVVFFHGGGYTGGERSPVPGVVYDNVPAFFARHGMVGVNATYRLAPAHKWPSGGEDVGRVVRWLARNAGRLGGDPGRIFLIGHSAGASHVAAWTFMRRLHGEAGPMIRGAVLISGVYAFRHPDFSAAPPRPNELAYYGEDASAWPAMAPFDEVRPGHPPAFIVFSELEPYHYWWPSVALLGALMRCDGRAPWLRYLPDHNHISSALQINSASDSLGADLLRFVAASGG